MGLFQSNIQKRSEHSISHDISFIAIQWSILYELHTGQPQHPSGTKEEMNLNMKYTFILFWLVGIFGSALAGPPYQNLTQILSSAPLCSVSDP